MRSSNSLRVIKRSMTFIRGSLETWRASQSVLPLSFRPRTIMVNLTFFWPQTPLETPRPRPVDFSAREMSQSRKRTGHPVNRAEPRRTDHENKAGPYRHQALAQAVQPHPAPLGAQHALTSSANFTRENPNPWPSHRGLGSMSLERRWLQ